jgi:hypothetical protein
LVAESLSDNSEFIKARFHIDRFNTIAVDTEAERINSEALQTDLASAPTRINLSISSSYDSLLSLLNLDPPPFSVQNLIEHSLSKDKYLRVALKRLTETQLL